MSKLAKPFPIDAALLAEFQQERRAGKYDDLVPPTITPLDPETDPFGMGYGWLDSTGTDSPFGAAYDTVVVRSDSEIIRKASSIVRRTAMTGSLAGASDEEIFARWTRKGFEAICFSTGAEGRELLAYIRDNPGAAPDAAERLAAFLGRQTDFSETTLEERVGLAVAILNTR